MDLIREIQQIIALNEQEIANRNQAADLIRQEIEDCGTEIDRRELEYAKSYRANCSWKMARYWSA